MAWPPTQIDSFTPHSADWNLIVNALSTAGGSYNANQNVFSNYLQVIINPAVSTDGLAVLPPARTTAGTQFGGLIRLRANSFDTVNHTRDFYARVETSSNAGAVLWSLFTQLD